MLKIASEDSFVDDMTSRKASQTPKSPKVPGFPGHCFPGADERRHLYEVDAPAGPDVVALQFADRRAAEAFGKAVAAAFTSLQELDDSLTSSPSLLGKT